VDGVGEVLEAAREAYRRRDWAGARERFAAARAAGELAAADLDALADAAWWLGEVDEASAVLEAAYRRHLDDGRPGRAAMAAIVIAVNHLLRGDGAVGSGWLGRARRLVRDEPEGVANGYLLYLELRRLRGDLDGAEAAYLQAHALGRDPQPGLALLRLAQGRADTAAASLRAALTAVTSDRLARAWLCAAQVEVALAAGDPETAGRASEELGRTASTYGSSGLEAAALQARGAVLLADGRPEAALPTLRAACRRWQELDAPYDAARVRLLLSRAYQALGDADAAGRELEAAGAVFERLGAAPDLEQVGALRGRPSLPGGLTGREAEVLALVAAGRTNREIAELLVLSPKTVARHLSNIFVKLEVTSRTQAAAYAFEHGLATPERG
jgi:DNA-binding NarL/FixJ family response regulator